MDRSNNHYFLGSNTYTGFYSLFNYLINLNKSNRVIYLKGGPGTGKSSLMKKVGEYYLDKGYEVEFHHCSSDSTSLDGIVVKELKIAMLDATAPHNEDPKIPGAVDEILDLGKYWNKNNLIENKNEIIKLQNKVSNIFKTTYSYLNSAKNIRDNIEYLNKQNMDLPSIENLILKLSKRNLPCAFNFEGETRHLFASAITPSGVVSFIDKLILNYKKIYILKGEIGTFKSYILESLLKEIQHRGLYAEVFHHPLIPKKIEHIIIPSLNLAILSFNEMNYTIYDKLRNIDGKIINLNDLNKNPTINEELIKKEKEDFYYILNNAIKILSTEKVAHDELEEIYVSNMDFSKMDSIFQNVLDIYN